uniref:Uncharacterized protein n=1 Tax=Oryza meridionalis TaxID=40149 RepID=A0A0E0DUZ9_9ORYZ
MSRRFLFQEFSSVLSRSMPNRPTSAEGGGVSAINNVFNGALRRFSTVIPNNHGLHQAKCLNSIQSPNAATKANHPTIGVVGRCFQKRHEEYKACLYWISGFQGLFN